MEKERIQPARNSRTIQQRNAGSANIMDNRPDGARNYLSATPVQRVEEDDEDVLQGKLSTPAQRVESEEDDDEVLQGKMAEPVPKNETGLPDNLKAGVESLSGYSLDDVRVHYNSSKPAAVQALAYTQGTDIHVAPGQEKHLPHEAWHVAQQMAGRVSPTTNINGMPVNDNAALEYEADVMGEKAVGQRKKSGETVRTKTCEPVVSQLGGGGEYYGGSYLKEEFPTNTFEIDEAIEKVIDDTWDDICYLYLVNGPYTGPGMIKALLEEKYTNLPADDVIAFHVNRIKENHMKEAFKRILMLRNIFDFGENTFYPGVFDGGEYDFATLRDQMGVQAPDGDSMEKSIIEGLLADPDYFDRRETPPVTPLSTYLFEGLREDSIDKLDKEWIQLHGDSPDTVGRAERIGRRTVYHHTRPGSNRSVFWVVENGRMKVVACGGHVGGDNNRYRFYAYVPSIMPGSYNRV